MVLKMLFIHFFVQFMYTDSLRSLFLVNKCKNTSLCVSTCGHNIQLEPPITEQLRVTMETEDGGGGHGFRPSCGHMKSRHLCLTS